MLRERRDPWTRCQTRNCGEENWHVNSRFFRWLSYSLLALRPSSTGWPKQIPLVSYCGRFRAWVPGWRRSSSRSLMTQDDFRKASGRLICGADAGQYQSGDCDRQGRISHQGNPLLRSLLVEVSWVGLQHNPWMRAVYEQVRRGSPTRKKIAIVAVARRLLIRCWAMLRDGVPWRPPNTEPIPSRTCGVVGAH